MCKAGIADNDALRAVFPGLQALMSDQKDSCDISFAVQRQSPWSRQFVRPGISQLQYTMADVSVVQVMQVHFLVVAQRPFLMVRPVWQTIEISQLQYAPGGQCSCCAGRASLVKLAQDVLVGPCTQVHGQG